MRRFFVALVVLVALSARGQTIDVSGMTNGNSFLTRRLFAIETALQVNANTLNIFTNALNNAATSNAFVSADTALSNVLAAADAALLSGYGSADTAVSNAFVSSDTALSNVLAAADAALLSGYGSADAAVSNAFISADTGLSNSVSTLYLAADTALSNGTLAAYVAADGVLSNLLAASIASNAAGYVSADTGLSNGLTSAYVAADTVLSNALAGAGGVPGNWSTVSNNAMTATQPADLAAASNGLTSAYIAADTALSNALASAGGGSATVPISPYGMVLAYTFDDAGFTNDWWGVNHATATSVTQKFDSVQGGYMDLPETTATLNQYKSPSITLGTNHTVFLKFKTVDSSNQQYLFDYSNSYYCYITATEYFGLYTSATVRYFESGGYTHGAWHTVSWVYSDSGLVGYFNGEQKFSVAETATLNSPISLGFDGSTSQGPTQVASCYVWGRSLTSNEVARLHALEIQGQYGVQGLRRP
jgi:hypothetical protein